MAKSLCLAYTFWLFGGFFGLHHLYLRRYIQAFLWWCLPGGYFGAGWFRDLWRIPEYVRDANNDPKHLRDVTEKMKQMEKPPFSMVRCMGQMIVGNTFGLLVQAATPNEEAIGIDLSLVPKILQPFGTALGQKQLIQ